MAEPVFQVGDTIDRYVLEELMGVISPGSTETGFRQYPVEYWRGRDTSLGRSVAIRLVRHDDARMAALLGAARATALVDDRRLMRVLDVLTVPAQDARPTYTAVMSEWAEGTALTEQILRSPLEARTALSIIIDVAQALAVALDCGVPHGRLRPGCVFLTDAGEVRISGLAIDNALFGPVDPGDDSRMRGNAPSDDVDGLGSLLYAMTTGYWPNPEVSERIVGLPSAPIAGKSVPVPSNIRASIPRPIDDVVARSVLTVSRPRGSVRIADASGFATAAGTALDAMSTAPATSLRIPRVTPSIRTGGRKLGARPLIGGVIAAIVVIGLFFIGAQLLQGGIGEESTAGEESGQTLDPILTTEAIPFEETLTFSEPQAPLTPVTVRSFDPFADDNGDGKTDKKRGRENEDDAALAIDIDPATEWRTDLYRSADADGKGGVGLIVDLGQPEDIQEVYLSLYGYGTDVEIKVSDEILRDPALWTPFVSVQDAGPTLDVRSPRPVRGQYVLIWLTGLPREAGTSADRFRGGVGQVLIYAAPPKE